MNFKNKEFNKIYGLQVLWAFAAVFGWCLIYLYLYQQGFPQLEIAAYFTLTYLVSLITLALLSKIRSKRSLQLGLLFRLISFLLVLKFIVPYQLYLISIVFGIAIELFWIPYNIKFFQFSDSSKHGSMSGTLMFVWLIFNAILPLAAGYVAQQIGIRFIFALGVVVLLLAMLTTSKIKKEFSLAINLRHSLKQLADVKLLFIISGFWRASNWIALPLYTLFFTQSEVEFGGLLALMGVFAAFASLLFAKLSDSTDRVSFIFPSVLLAASFCIISGFASSITQWAVTRALVSFFMAIAAPFDIALVLDHSQDIKQGLIGREFLLAIGYVLAGINALLAILLGSIRYALILAGVIYLLYPLIIKWKKIYPPRQITLTGLLSGLAGRTRRRFGID